MNHSTFSKDEVEAKAGTNAVADFLDAFYVVLDGFLPGEIGITTTTPSATDIANAAPIIPPPGSGVTITFDRLEPEDPGFPAQVFQRFVFVYKVSIDKNLAFAGSGTQVLTMTATAKAFSATAQLTLTSDPNPYMIDGSAYWLSTDLRVFKVRQNDTRFSKTMGTDGSAYINDVLGVITDADFSGIGDEVLELAQKVSTVPVFNFAVARVRYRAPLTAASNVQVFFRLFTTAATGFDYDDATAYRRSIYDTVAQKAVPLLGRQLGSSDITTIPCFAAPREETVSGQPGATSMTSQRDDVANMKTLPATGTESVTFFGCTC